MKTLAALLLAVAMAVPQYDQYDEYGSKSPSSSNGGSSSSSSYGGSSSGVSSDQWAALNPYGSGAGVPADIQRQWDSFLVRKTK